MPTLNQAIVGDNYTTAATLRDIWNARGGWFNVSSAAAVFVQLQYGTNGTDDWTDEQELGAGSSGTLPDDAVGVRFRNAVAGQTAVVSVTIAQGQEPALAIAALGIITTSGVPPTRTVITAVGSGTYLRPAGCVGLLVEVLSGGGGGGGAANAAANQEAVGGGGSGSAYVWKLISNPASSYPYTIGGGGLNGATGNNPGSDGGMSSFGTGPLVQADPGKGGFGGASGLVVVAPGRAAGLLSASIGDGGCDGGQAEVGFGTGQLAIAGQGGSGGGPYGAGTRATASQNGTGSVNGPAGGTPGGGGMGGASVNAGGTAAGGGGGTGLIVITEFY